MSGKLLPLRPKNIYYYTLFLVILCASLWLIFTISGFQMNYLSYLLYDKSHLSAVYRLLNQFVLRKLLISVVLFLTALVMVYLFYFSYYQLVYLKLAILCLCCICYSITLSETNTIFYIGNPDAQLWNNASIISVLFLVMFLFQLTFDFLMENRSFLPGLCITACLLILSIFMSFQRYASNVRLLPIFILALLVLYIILAAMAFLQKTYGNLLQTLPVLAGALYLLYTNYIYRLHNYNIAVLNQRTAHYGISLYVSVITTYCVLFSTLVRKRGYLMHSRQLNRKLQELENAKYTLLGVLYSHVRNCIFGANTALDSLQTESLSPDSAKNVEHVRTELINISALYNQIHNYTIFSGNSMNLYQIRINIHIFFKLFAQRLDYSGQLTANDTVAFSSRDMYHDIYTDIYPEHLLQSLEDLMTLIRQQNPEGYFQISNSIDEHTVFLKLDFYNSCSRTAAKRKSSALFHTEPPVLTDPSGLDYSLSLLRHQIKSCGGVIQLNISGEFRLKIGFPITAYSPSLYEQNTFFCERKEAKHLLVLTSDQEQMEVLKKILPFDQYHITLANDADYYFEHPQELAQYALLIVGNLYRRIYFRDFYNLVRRDYPMTALPILMLLPDLYSENSFYIRNTINDYLIPPYSQVSLSKKIHSLLMVKETADIALEAQLEFWQSQINPHFIFNSINSIMHMCIREPMKAYELLDDFSEYLRGHLLSQSLNRLSTIQKEVNIISAYLQIEKARFSDKIHYELDIDCDENFPILPLLIEPLVENSIKHSPMHESGVSVNVHIFQQEELLLVRVEDDGNGMPPETVQAILSNTYESHSIGLSNLCKRLYHYYHTAPSIDSTPGKGTIVEFTIQRRFSHDTGIHY